MTKQLTVNAAIRKCESKGFHPTIKDDYLYVTGDELGQRVYIIDGKISRKDLAWAIAAS